MPHDHPGFDHWDPNDIDHPFPVGDIDLQMDRKDGAIATAEMTPPKTQPKPNTVAERSIGIPRSAQLWFAFECVTDLQGNLRYEGVFRGRHVHWYDEHGEKGVGPVQEIRVSAGDLSMWGRRESLAAHGPHCDLFTANWAVKDGVIKIELCVLHFEMTVPQFYEARERSRGEAERMPPLRPSRIVPEGPLEPPPKPDPVPDGAMRPGRPGGLLGGLLALVRRIGRAIFG